MAARSAARLTLGFIFTMAAGSVIAAPCGKSAAGFSAWLADFKKEAAATGVSQGTINSALAGATYNASVVSLDRKQGHFKLSFQKFYSTRGAPLEGAARSKLSQNAALLKKIEQRFGVPGAVIVAIWGLETGFGGNVGNMQTMRSLATLAYDCRRSAFFKNELISALKIAQRGDLSPSQMRGAWAGELGQTQFLASSYLKFAVDFDGNGRRDLIKSRADALASTANYLKAYGWKTGQPWSEGTANFQVLLKWNKASVYAKTIAQLSSRLGGSS
jgi:lytic murein transglycosylase